MTYDQMIELKGHPENFEPTLEDFASAEDQQEAFEELEYIQECERKLSRLCNFMNNQILVLEDTIKDTIKELEGQRTTREEREKLADLVSDLNNLIISLIVNS